jgi:ankyrin repeat protein
VVNHRYTTFARIADVCAGLIERLDAEEFGRRPLVAEGRLGALDWREYADWQARQKVRTAPWAKVETEQLERFIWDNKFDSAKELLTQKPWVATRPSMALWAASRTGNLPMVKLLLAFGADARQEFRGEEPFVLDGFAGALWTASEKFSGYPMYWKTDPYGVLQTLLEHGASPDEYVPKLGYPAALFAAQLDVKYLKLLLDHGVDPRRPLAFQGSPQCAPIHAASMGTLSNLRLLVERGADVNQETVEGFTPLFLAAWFDQPATAKFLRSHGALETFQVACLLGDVQKVEESLRADPSLIDRAEPALGFTPLHLAVQANRLDILRLLLKHNAIRNSKAPKKEINVYCGMILVSAPDWHRLTTPELVTPAQLARSLGRQEAVRILEAPIR